MPRLVLPQQLADRRGQSELRQDLRVQFGDGGPQPRRGVLQRRVDVVQRRVGDPVTGFVELETRGQALIEVGKRRIVRVSFEG